MASNLKTPKKTGQEWTQWQSWKEKISGDPRELKDMSYIGQKTTTVQIIVRENILHTNKIKVEKNLTPMSQKIWDCFVSGSGQPEVTDGAINSAPYQ